MNHHKNWRLVEGKCVIGKRVEVSEEVDATMNPPVVGTGGGGDQGPSIRECRRAARQCLNDFYSRKTSAWGDDSI